MLTRTTALLASAVLTSVVAYAGVGRANRPELDRQAVLEFSLTLLGKPAADAGNRWADDPEAAALGRRLFFDTRLSANGKVSCASCHDPSRDFQDSIALGNGIGTTARRTMPIAGSVYAPFLFWDGRKDSLWAQALAPLESAVEHGGSRALHARVVASHYRGEYQSIFGPLPDLAGVPAVAGPVEDPAPASAWRELTPAKRDAVTEVFVNIGKAIAAYERQIQYTPSRFDRFIDAWQSRGAMPRDVLDSQELAGLALFLGKANCTQCHNGPLLTNNEFHNTGVPRRGLANDRGRSAAIAAVQTDEFNCRSRWSDAKADECPELDFLVSATEAQERAFKVPSLRNVAERAPYMHAGQFSSLAEVLQHYNRAPKAPAGHTELKPLGLTNAELRELEAFLRTLSGAVGVSAALDSAGLPIPKSASADADETNGKEGGWMAPEEMLP